VSDARAAVLDALRAARARAPGAADRAPAPGSPARAASTVPTDAEAGRAPAALRAGFGQALRAAFGRALAAAGGALAEAPPGAPLQATLAALPVYRAARRVASTVPGLASAGLESPAPADPRAFDGLDLAVVPGAFGVAENGAVWVDAGALPHRALLWLAEHLVLVVPADALVADLHEAYARLRFDRPGFGVFVAGPSKTADIEQALVIGAQGPRSTTVVLAEAPPSPPARSERAAT
jgi:L-lactate dehydrogenase complex protein LldG